MNVLSISVGGFLLSALTAVALFLGQPKGLGEVLRSIPGNRFLPGVIFAALILCGGMLVFLSRSHRQQLEEELQKLGKQPITHRDVPHIFGVSRTFQRNGYYLLALYLQGLVRYEAEEKGEGDYRLILDEEKFRSVAESGDRVSRPMQELANYLCDKKRSMKNALQPIPGSSGPAGKHWSLTAAATC